MARKIDWLIAGLGNPEKKYANNRHNIGWMVAAELCRKNRKPIMPFSPDYLQSSMRINNELVFVALPTTFMNRSGRAIKSICEMYDIPYDKVVVIVDEYNFPVGRVHLKAGGGDGGHNGVASVIEELDYTDFMRLRCGIGRDFGEGGLVNYVLSDFNEDEAEERDMMILKAVDAIEHLVRIGKARAMSEINSGRLWPEERNEGEDKKEIDTKESDKADGRE